MIIKRHVDLKILSTYYNHTNRNCILLTKLLVCQIKAKLKSTFWIAQYAVHCLQESKKSSRRHVHTFFHCYISFCFYDYLTELLHNILATVYTNEAQLSLAICKKDTPFGFFLNLNLSFCQKYLTGSYGHIITITKLSHFKAKLSSLPTIISNGQTLESD